MANCFFCLLKLDPQFQKEKIYMDADSKLPKILREWLCSLTKSGGNPLYDSLNYNSHCFRMLH